MIGSASFWIQVGPSRTPFVNRQFGDLLDGPVVETPKPKQSKKTKAEKAESSKKASFKRGGKKVVTKAGVEHSVIGLTRGGQLFSLAPAPAWPPKINTLGAVSNRCVLVGGRGRFPPAPPGLPRCDRFL